MKFFKLIIILSFLFNNYIFAQEDLADQASMALKAGSAKELSSYFNEGVEIGEDDQKAVYGRTQAEFVMKDFFRRYVPQDFKLVHQGASKEGLRYAIGLYTYPKGSFRVMMLIKQSKGKYGIDSLVFTKE